MEQIGKPFEPHLAQLIEENLRLVPDYPEPGVLFRDITPLVADGRVLQQLVQSIAPRYRGRVDQIAGVESRGFIWAAPLAATLGVGMLMIRKAGKLPDPIVGVDYELEYGSARLEICPNTVMKDARVLVVDDVLATGGTAKAAKDLVEQCGGQVTSMFMLMELVDLAGRQNLGDIPIEVILQLHEKQSQNR